MRRREATRTKKAVAMLVTPKTPLDRYIGQHQAVWLVSVGGCLQQQQQLQPVGTLAESTNNTIAGASNNNLHTCARQRFEYESQFDPKTTNQIPGEDQANPGLYRSPRIESGSLSWFAWLEYFVSARCCCFCFLFGASVCRMILVSRFCASLSYQQEDID